MFGAVVEKQAISPDDGLEYAFEQIISRFDRFLGRMHKKNNTQRGLLILDKSTQETRLQRLTRDFRMNGHRWGRLNNLVDVPFFVDSKATRAIQYADMVAYALWRHFEKGDSEFYNVIDTAFDAEGGVRHGLHIKQSPTILGAVAKVQEALDDLRPDIAHEDAETRFAARRQASLFKAAKTDL